MANPKHLEILRLGAKAWNEWRDINPEVKVDLFRANLRGADLRRASLGGANLGGAILDGADLSGAELIEANLMWADLRHAVFAGAVLTHASLVDAKLAGAVLTHASLANANLSRASLVGAYLVGAHLANADLNGADLSGADFSAAVLRSTIFANSDLRDVKGLEAAIHMGPSEISISTIYKSEGKIPEAFLLGCGVPESLITQIPSLAGAVQPIQFHSCFISYSSKDEEFARRLHSRMREAGLRVWFAPEDMKGGDYFFDQIDRAIQVHDRLLLVLSENSMASNWVVREMKRARKAEARENRKKLFPISLTGFEALRGWECLDSDSGLDLAEEVRRFHIPDFSNWKNHDEFEKAFARLHSDLKKSAEGR